jgi:DNA-binding GntR family transcriptional regulator
MPLIQKEILRDKIADVLREWILNGTLKPGERIVELGLAEKLQVSRAPFREALWLLARQGLVRIKAHQGAFVAQLSARDIREIFEIRELLETHAARRIRRAPGPEAAGRLRAALRELEEAARLKDIRRFSNADFTFHRTLWELSGNAHLAEVMSDLSARFFGYELIRDLPRPESFRFDATLGEHREMVRLALEGTDAQIEAGYRKIFAAFLAYVLERFGEDGNGAPAAS